MAEAGARGLGQVNGRVRGARRSSPQEKGGSALVVVGCRIAPWGRVRLPLGAQDLRGVTAAGRGVRGSGGAPLRGSRNAAAEEAGVRPTLTVPGCEGLARPQNLLKPRFYSPPRGAGG